MTESETPRKKRERLYARLANEYAVDWSNEEPLSKEEWEEQFKEEISDDDLEKLITWTQKQIEFNKWARRRYKIIKFLENFPATAWKIIQVLGILWWLLFLMKLLT